MEEIKTVKVKSWDPEQGDHVVINEADFDPKVHELYEAPNSEPQKPKKPSDGLKVDELKAALADKGLEIPDGAKKADLAALLDAAQ